jgi:hypothetical protein
MVDMFTFVDAERYVGEALRAASTGAGTRVYSSIPKSPTWPLITLQRIGGMPVDKHRVDRASIQIAVWADTKSAAHDIAQEARVAILRMEGTTPNGAVIAGVTDQLGMTWQPDPVTQRDRYIFGMMLVIHPA